VQLTRGWRGVLPERIRDRYEVLETRNAAAILKATDSHAFAQVLRTLDRFSLSAAHLLLPGGNEGLVAKQLNAAMREQGWREARVDTTVQHTLVKFRAPGSSEQAETAYSLPAQSWTGYKADWVKGRIAGDCEWNAKDGNLDRNFASYRSLYEAGFIDGAVLVTRTMSDLQELETHLLQELMEVGADHAAAVTGYPTSGFAASIERIHKMRAEGKKELRLGTTTSTNTSKLKERLKRGDGGGCPILVIGISSRTFDGVGLLGAPSTPSRPVAAVSEEEMLDESDSDEE